MGRVRAPGACRPLPQDRFYARLRDLGRRRETQPAAVLFGTGQDTIGQAVRERRGMKKTDRAQRAAALNPAVLDALIDEITVDAYGEDEQFWAFRQAFEDNVAVPCDGYLIGDPVSVIEFDYDGNERRGLTAKCRRAGGRQHILAAADVTLPPGTEGARYLAAYRKWMGLPPHTAEVTIAARHESPRQSRTAALHLGRTVELVVLSVKQKAPRC